MFKEYSMHVLLWRSSPLLERPPRGRLHFRLTKQSQPYLICLPSLAVDYLSSVGVRYILRLGEHDLPLRSFYD